MDIMNILEHSDEGIPPVLWTAERIITCTTAQADYVEHDRNC